MVLSGGFIMWISKVCLRHFITASGFQESTGDFFGRKWTHTRFVPPSSFPTTVHSVLRWVSTRPQLQILSRVLSLTWSPRISPPVFPQLELSSLLFFGSRSVIRVLATSLEERSLTNFPCRNGETLIDNESHTIPRATRTFSSSPETSCQLSRSWNNSPQVSLQKTRNRSLALQKSNFTTFPLLFPMTQKVRSFRSRRDWIKSIVPFRKLVLMD